MQVSVWSCWTGPTCREPPWLGGWFRSLTTRSSPPSLPPSHSSAPFSPSWWVAANCNWAVTCSASELRWRCINCSLCSLLWRPSGSALVALRVSCAASCSVLSAPSCSAGTSTRRPCSSPSCLSGQLLFLLHDLNRVTFVFDAAVSVQNTTQDVNLNIYSVISRDALWSYVCRAVASWPSRAARTPPSSCSWPPRVTTRCSRCSSPPQVSTRGLSRGN